MNIERNKKEKKIHRNKHGNVTNYQETKEAQTNKWHRERKRNIGMEIKWQGRQGNERTVHGRIWHALTWKDITHKLKEKGTVDKTKNINMRITTNHKHKWKQTKHDKRI